jgi:hypothetical protein
MSFNDDEEIVPQNEEPPPPIFVDGRVELAIKKNDEAPLEQNNQKVLLVLTGDEYSGDRLGLDLVAVLDVSASMQGDKIEKMKTAMQFVIKKLSPIDRISIVTFSSSATRLCPLRQITEKSKTELLGLIDGLKVISNTNISDGLRTGLKVLADRKVSGGRTVGVMLMSDGQQNEGGDAADVVIGNVPVHTFGFGADYDGKVLNAVARKSLGGTFNTVNDIDGLSMAFSQCLAGLLTTVAEDLTLKLETVGNGSIIQKATAGSYRQDPDAGSITIFFGNLYNKEVRQVIVDLLLPAVDKVQGTRILRVSYSYKTSGLLSETAPTTVSVNRTKKVLVDDVKPVPEVQTEEARLKTVTMIKAARQMADGKNLGDARDKLSEAQNALDDVEEQSSPLLDMLRAELSQLVDLMQSQDVYEKQGRPYALSSETSHDLQRFAARGDIVDMRLFATPRMNKYLEQAQRFDEDPKAPLPSVDEDVKEELAANPLAPIAGPITFHIQAAIQALQAIAKLINNGGNP